MARHHRLTRALGPENRSPGAVVPTEYVPFRDRRVNTLTVPCSSCNAAIGEPCISRTTGARTKSHNVRRRMALRAGA